MSDRLRVPPTGPLTASIAFCGEAPGADETISGTPFVGPAGEKLDSLLASVGLLRPNVYITNVFKEKIPNNDTSLVLPEGLLGPEPTPTFTEAKEELWAELSTLQAKVLIPLGNTALFALTGQTGIAQRRGSIWPCTVPGCQDKLVLPTFHPASALRNRNPINHFIIQMDLMKAVALATGQIQLPVDPLLHLDPPLSEVLNFLQRCLTSPRVGFDIESSTARVKGSRYTREMTMFSIALPPGTDGQPVESMAVPISLPGNEHRWSLEDEDTILCALFAVLESPTVLKIGQNLSYDASVLYHRYGTVLWPLEDTMMGSRIVCPDLPADLGFLCSIHTFQPYYKDLAGKENWQDFLRYSALDSAVVLDIWPRVERDLERQRNLGTYQRARDAFQPALFIQEHGLLLDKVAQLETRQKVRKEIDKLQAIVNLEYLAVKEKDPDWLADLEKQRADLALAKAGKRGTKGREEKLANMLQINVESPLQLCNFFYGKKPKGLGYPPLLADGRPTADDKARKRLIGKGCEVAKTIDQLIHLEKDMGKYWEATTDPDNRARCSIDVTGTDGLRWASKISMFGTGFQFFNMPKRFRPLLVADKGRPFIQMDLGQAENRIVAVLANDHRMMEAFRLGTDVHRLTAGLMFGIRPEEVSDQPGSSTLGDGKHSQRDWGKKANHAFNYGLGPSGAVEQLEISARDASFLYNAYHRAYPGVKQTFWAGVKDSVYRTRFLENLVGWRRLYLTPLTGENERAAYSFIPQSTVPEILRNWVMLPVYKDPDPAPSLVNHVYDSLEYQYDLHRDGLLGMANFILDLRRKADKPLHYKEKEFRIPADFKVGWSLGKLTDIKATSPQELAEELETILQGGL